VLLAVRFTQAIHARQLGEERSAALSLVEGLKVKVGNGRLRLQHDASGTQESCLRISAACLPLLPV